MSNTKKLKSEDPFLALNYEQVDFTIHELIKTDSKNNSEFKKEELRLGVEKKIRVATKKSDELNKRVYLDISVGISDGEGDILDGTEIITIKTSTTFQLVDGSDFTLIRPSLILQANIQATDIVNNILIKSELLDAEIGYELGK